MEPKEYFAALHARRHGALPIRHRDVSVPGWSPQQNKCHDNVDFWVKLNPHLRPVRGWMVLSEDASGHCLYEAHSIIEDNGELYDISIPGLLCHGIRFLKHSGSEEDFQAILKLNLNQVPYPQRTVEEFLADSATVAPDEDGEYDPINELESSF
jgi:hypothetical protein